MEKETGGQLAAQTKAGGVSPLVISRRNCIWVAENPPDRTEMWDLHNYGVRVREGQVAAFQPSETPVLAESGAQDRCPGRKWRPLGYQLVSPNNPQGYAT